MPYEVSEAFRDLRTKIQFCEDVKCITVTGCQRGEGKRLVSVELAKAISKIGKKVIVIDADMRRSTSKAADKDGEPKVGLSQYLSDTISIEDAVFETQYQNLYIMFAGEKISHPADLLCGDRFSELVERVKGEYDYVMIDTPPIGESMDAAITARRCDGAVIVISAGRIKCKDALEAKKQLENAGCKILGTVLNRAYSTRVPKFVKRIQSFFKSITSVFKRKSRA